MEDYSITIINLLERYDIPYSEEGKNVTEGITINTECPFCDDVSNHCGIFRNSMKFHCWKCGMKGDLPYLLARITRRPKEFFFGEIKASGVTFEQDSEQLIKDIFNPSIALDISEKRSFSVKLPEYFQPVQDANSILLDDYLLRRNISLDVLIQHQCGICEVGEYMNRLIIPVYFQGVLKGFQAAAMTVRAETKYKADTVNSLIKQYFYRWDRIDKNLDYVVVVEGILDAWRLYHNTLCSFGISLSSNQKKLLIKLNPKKLIFCPDSDAYMNTLRTAEEFTPFIEEVYIIQFPEGEDPDSYGKEESWALIEEEGCFIK